MKVNKIKTHELEKCYAISPLTYNGAEHILSAAEKVNKCLLFDLDGNLEETVWEEPGGTMSMVPVSYTHLDVYKRQRLRRPRLRMKEMGCTGGSIC